MRTIASAVDANYLKKTGDAATGTLTYSAAAAAALDFNDNLTIPTAGQVRFWGTAKYVPRDQRAFITRSTPSVPGWNGQPGAGSGQDLRYIIYNYGTGELLYSVTPFPQTRMAPSGAPEVSAATRSAQKMPTVREFTEGGETFIGFAMDDIPASALATDDDGNTIGYDIIKVAMMGFAELAALQTKVTDLEARLVALENK